jgi:hypothetical protein
VTIYLGTGSLVTNSGRRWFAFGPLAIAIVLVLVASLLAAVSLSLAILAITAIVAAALAVTAYRGARAVSARFAEGSPSSATRS